MGPTDSTPVALGDWDPESKMGRMPSNGANGAEPLGCMSSKNSER